MPQGPWGERAPCLLCASLAVHVGSERERFTGGQDGGSSSLDPTRCQEMGDEKEEATEKGPFPSSLLPSAIFSVLAAALLGRGVCRLVQVGSVCAYTRQSLLNTSVTMGL